MAMQFSRAERAQHPDLLQAVIAQNQLDQQQRALKQQEQQGYLSAGTELASLAPKGFYGGLLGGGGAGAAAPLAGGASLSAMPVATGTMAGMAAPTVAATNALGGGASLAAMPSLAGAGLGATGAGLGAAGAGLGAAGAGTAAAAPALAGAAPAATAGLLSNPLGWGALAVGALALMNQQRKARG